MEPTRASPSTAELQSSLVLFEKCYQSYGADFDRARAQISSFLAHPRLVQSITYRNAMTLLKCIAHLFGVFAPRIPVLTTTQLSVFWKLVISVFRVKTRDPQTVQVLDEILEILRATDAFTIVICYEQEISEALISYSQAGAEFAAKLPNSIEFIRKHLSNRAFTTSLSKETQSMVIIEMMKQTNGPVVKTIMALDKAFGLNLLDVLYELKNEILSEEEQVRTQAIDISCSVIQTANIREEHCDLVKFILSRHIDICERIRMRIVDFAFHLLENESFTDFASQCLEVITSRMSDPSKNVRLRCWEKKLPIEYDYGRYILDISGEVCDRVVDFCCDDLEEERISDCTPLIAFHMQRKSPKLLERFCRLTHKFGYISMWEKSNQNENFFMLVRDCIPPDLIDASQVLEHRDTILISNTAKLFPELFCSECETWLDYDNIPEDWIQVLASVYEHIIDKKKFLMRTLEWGTPASLIAFATAARNSPHVKLSLDGNIIKAAFDDTTMSLDIEAMPVVLTCNFLLRLGDHNLVPPHIFDVNFSRISRSHTEQLMALSGLCGPKISVDVNLKVLQLKRDKQAETALVNIIRSQSISLDQICEVATIASRKDGHIKSLHKAVQAETTLSALMIDLFLAHSSKNTSKTSPTNASLRISESALAKLYQFACRMNVPSDFLTAFLIRKFDVKSVMETCQLFISSNTLRHYCREAMAYCLARDGLR